MENQIGYNEKPHPISAQPATTPGDPVYEPSSSSPPDSEAGVGSSKETPAVLEAESESPLQKIHSVNNINSVPNGGLKAWLQVLGAFFLMFNTW